ncbi:glutamate-5-semialdehyde dehydrogenase [Kushneria phosphatilytica]|uniref:Gamma-glutamyl phosphate reductase n=1 Tax=Kushneria phosphatilytica TaxID=657387 RepID=A0A1S1P2N3_9GAMM|nr:glutamate-5-semialdehyde dehydrogenase [Kushneria phosphatilytica]OHV13040.1 glutamate-5-semialdehyde dehydrogenase [Kushneria phosphatilytica]QEL10913.1 glutamate-5-semialdehyde dehydrogenase [Kushneria phosphatilytica]
MASSVETRADADSDQGEDVTAHVTHLGQQARRAAAGLREATTGDKNTALHAMAAQLEQQREILRTANERDLEQAQQDGLSAALLDRLTLDDRRIDAMIAGLETVAALPDPVGEIDELSTRPNGLQIGRMRVPLGVIGIIYESRPNVTIDAAALCLKSGNAAILRGGSEAVHSNAAIAECIRLGLAEAGLPEACVQRVGTRDRQAVGALIRMDQYVDVIIPRGGRSLIERISADATVPVIKHLEGICHVYVDRHADLNQAWEVAFNAKCYRYGICGAMETLLVDESIAADFLPEMARRLMEAGVELRGCDRTRQLIAAEIAEESDWSTEYLAPILSIRVVEGLQAAIEHINHYGSHHTDAIVSQHLGHTRRFMAAVDSSSVMVNAATCFADGGEYGLGAEIGISTNRLHVRGPVGLQGLTTQKYIVIGDGHVRH